VNELIRERRAVSPEMALRLGRLFVYPDLSLREPGYREQTACALPRAAGVLDQARTVEIGVNPRRA
jgi:hypothetical protein